MAKLHFDYPFDCPKNCSKNTEINEYLNDIQIKTGAQLKYIQTVQILGTLDVITKAKEILDMSHLCLLSHDCPKKDETCPKKDETSISYHKVIQDKIFDCEKEIAQTKQMIQIMDQSMKNESQEIKLYLTTNEDKITEEIKKLVINMGHALKLDIQNNGTRLHDAFKQMQKNTTLSHKLMAEMVSKQLQFKKRDLEGSQKKDLIDGKNSDQSINSGEISQKKPEIKSTDVVSIPKTVPNLIAASVSPIGTISRETRGITINRPTMSPILFNPGFSGYSGSSGSSSGQCLGTTQKGARCRNSVSGGGYCHHHC